MRECWVIEEQDTETDEWRTEITFEHEDAAVEACKRWVSDYKHRVDEDEAAGVLGGPHTPQEAK